MNFTIPEQGVFGVVASVGVDQQDMTLANSLQALIKAQSAFANLNASNSTQTVASADTAIDQTLTATGSQS
jgi:hypothetical protein